MNALTFCIGGVLLRLCSDMPLGMDARWAQYRAADAAPDFTYHITHAVPQPPQGQSTPLDYGKQLLLTSDAAYRIYCDVTSGKPFALSRTELAAPKVCHITADPEKLPWGTQVQHFFEQLSLQHALLQKKRLLLHGAYVLTENGAIVFTAPSGTGKTTQAALWKTLRGADIINGDRLVLGAEKGRVLAYGVPLSGSSEDCKNVTAPVRAVVALSQAKENRAAPCTKAEAARILLNGTYLPQEYQSDLPAALDAAVAIAEHASCYTLACLPDETAVAVLERLL